LRFSEFPIEWKKEEKMIHTFNDIYRQLEGSAAQKIVIAAADDEDVLRAVQKATEKKLIIPVLVGNSMNIKKILHTIGYNFKGEIINTATDIQAAEVSIKMVSSGKAKILMKGLMASSILLKAVLNKEWGLRSGHLLSHIGFIQPQNTDRILMITDGGMNIAPDLDQKKNILENAVETAHNLLIDMPKVAALSAVETVNPAMQSSVDAALLAKMNERGQIRGCIVDGPLAMDNAVSTEAAKHKGIVSPVAGYADILLVPNIETGNATYKALHFFSNAKFAGTIAGASAPIVLTSRSDSSESKQNSIAIAAFIATIKSR